MTERVAIHPQRIGCDRWRRFYGPNRAPFFCAISMMAA
jgi:hypothetical protein